MGFEDLKQIMLHAVLLAPGPLRAHLHTYLHVCVTTGTSRAGTRSIPQRIFCWLSFFVELDKCETHPYIDCLPLPPMRDVCS
jgi:hypothetical protein